MKFFRARLRGAPLKKHHPVSASRLWHSEEWLAVELASSVDVAPRWPHREGYLHGCHHHLDGLVTRCRSCQDRARSIVDLRVG